MGTAKSKTNTRKMYCLWDNKLEKVCSAKMNLTEANKYKKLINTSLNKESRYKVVLWDDSNEDR